jgi:hypothetical protein
MKYLILMGSRKCTKQAHQLVQSWSDLMFIHAQQILKLLTSNIENHHFSTSVLLQYSIKSPWAHYV